MARKGRNRMTGERYPSGDLKRALPEPTASHPAALRRFKEVALASVHAQEYGTPLGRLLLEERITQHEYAAGKEWGQLHREYQSAMGLLRHQPRSLAIGEASHGAEPDPDSETGRSLGKRAAKTIQRFDACHRALMDAGMLAERATRKLCEGQGIAPFGHAEYFAAKTGLAALAQFFRDGKRRSS